ncbi:hypothetical protein AWU65_16160 [Paenibacillus glucanolyticus]|uniref:Uncharacterized protein n=1 Tax=Paenibacillus glucanolyticus TaxID=59843 RepID=A0A163KM69_9BACL|nr:hypothetical protein [Paenibacillus glucanolyticus]KZS47350.1 hypothetical protein AWU65_16160 [Paenibacillus glucanolyticus]
MSHIQNMSMRLNQLSSQLTAAGQNGRLDEVGLIVSELSQIYTELQNLQAAVTPETSSSARQELVNCRIVLHGMMDAVQDIRTATAEQYRQVLGENKTVFEQLDEAAQQSEYSQAYQYRLAFKQMDEVSQHLHQLDGSMLDTGYQLERGAMAGDTLNGAVQSEDLTLGTDEGGAMM